ncbi:MAG: DUF58 domain-containing protein [Magnetospirillum sp.]|nr:DUF58 domain-containing protein [Magnetospirillum sp.]
MAAGVHGRHQAGPGETFWQYRTYQPGDPATAVDWRQSARGERLFVREREWAASQTVWLWRDASPSMAWRSTPALPEKRERAELLVLALAAVLLRGGERVAPLGGDMPPASGGSALARLAASLPPPTGNGSGLPGPERLSRHAEVVLVSDFLMPLEDMDSRVRALAATGAVGHLLQVLDPAEEVFPFTGRVRFSGMEGEGETVIRRSEDVRAGYRDRLAAHRDGLAGIARAVGWSFAVHHTDQSPQTPLLALHMRLSGSRSGGGR